MNLIKLKSSIFLCTIIALATVFAAAGCRNMPPPESLELTVINESKESFNAAASFAAGLNRSLGDGDFKHWQQVLPPELAERITAARFLNMQKDFAEAFGRFTGSEYLGVLNQALFQDHLWKIKFVRKPAGAAQEVPKEIVMWVRVYQEKGRKPAVGGFGFHPF